MKLRFENDAFFKKNVTINKTLIASQIEEPVDRENVITTYQKQEEAIISINLSTEPPPIKHSVQFNLTLPDGAFNFLVTSCKATVEYYYKEKEEDIGWIKKVETFEVTQTSTSTSSENNKTFTASITYRFPSEGVINSPQIKFVLQYSYSVNEVKTSNSYFNKTSLYGENGILRDIQNRLENLKSNFEAMGFEYDTNDEFSSNIKTLTVDSAAVDDVILPKEVYDGEITSLSEILKDVNRRLNPWEGRELRQSGTIYNNNAEEIGTFIKDDDLLVGHINQTLVAKEGSDFAYMTVQTKYTLSQTIIAYSRYGLPVYIQKDGDKILLQIGTNNNSYTEDISVDPLYFGIQLQ